MRETQPGIPERVVSEVFRASLTQDDYVLFNTIHGGPVLLHPANRLLVETLPEDAAKFQRRTRPQH